MGKIGICLAEVWWAIMIILVATCITFEISSLAIPRWFVQGTGLYSWQGGLLTPYPSSTWYKDKACDRDFHGSGYCDMFKNLWIGGLVYIIFEGISLALYTTCIILYVVEIAKSKKLALTLMVLNWAAVAAHLVGFLTWAILGKMQYEGSCNDFYMNSGASPANICRKEGATMALFIILYIPVIAMIQSVLWYQSKAPLKDARNKHEFQAPEEHISSPEESSREPASISEEFSK